jgi:hypothetical protein
MILDKILHKNNYNYGIDYDLRMRNKGDSIEFFSIEKFNNEKEYKFYVSTYRPLIKKVITNRIGESDHTWIWSDLPEKIDDAFDKEMQWHYNRTIALAEVDYNISSLILSPHGIFFYSIGSNLYTQDLKISNENFKNSKILSKNIMWQIDPVRLNFINKYEIRR